MRTSLALLALILTSQVVLWAAAPPPLQFKVTNPGRLARHEALRLSVPLPRGAYAGSPSNMVALGTAGHLVSGQARAITRWPDGSLRRVMVTVPVDLKPGETLRWDYDAARSSSYPSSLSGKQAVADRLQTEAYAVVIHADKVQLMGQDGRVLGLCSAYGPALANPAKPTLEVIEQGPAFLWLRWRQAGMNYTREVDVQVDCVGKLHLTQRVLRNLEGNDSCPDFGFDVSLPGGKPVRLPASPVHFLKLPIGMPLAQVPDTVASAKLSDGMEISAVNPLALRQHRGTLSAQQANGATGLRFSRLEPVERDSDKLILQEGAWQSMELVLQPGTPEQLADSIDSPLVARLPWQAYDAVYRNGPPLEVKNPVLKRLSDKYISTILSIPVLGDDLGFIGGLDRYNHCAYVWDDYYRTGDPLLRRMALEWSENYNDFSVYWGPNPSYYGGGRYPAVAATQPWFGSFHTRYNNAVSFCTKGYHSFWLAYEETGDTRFKYAAEQEAKWSSTNVHASLGDMRSIGQVTDYVRMYEYTGDEWYLGQADRLWTEFQVYQQPDLLFTQGGEKPTGNDLYIPEDDFGLKHPFYKSYIVQYATNALPDLLKYRPDDAKLRATILACNDWMVKAQTPGGGWGYPGPTTAGLSWIIEYDHGLMRGCEIERRPAYLDALQRDLRVIATMYERHGAIAASISSPEQRAGKTFVEMGEMYKRADDRDRMMDFRDGLVGFGGSPDSTVYFNVLLRDYLTYRSEASLFTPDPVLDLILRLPTTLDGNETQTGDPSLQIETQRSLTPAGMQVTLTAQATYRLTGKQLAFHWLFADGSTASGARATHTYTKAGTYKVSLTAKHGSDTYQHYITLVAPVGPADFGLRTMPVGIRIQAEDFVAQGGGDMDLRILGDKLGADGKVMAYWNALGRWAEWPFGAAAGDYYVVLKYATPEDVRRTVSIDGAEVGTIALPPTGGYSGPTRDDWSLGVLRDAGGHPLKVRLTGGKNLLRLTNSDNKGCNLDWVEFLPAAGQ